MSIQNNNTENAQSTEMFLLSAENFENEKFYIVRFHGTEALNELFNFSIDFVCTNKSLDTDSLMSNLTTFSIIRKNGEIANFTGYPINVEQSGHFGDYAYYHIDLRPTFWKMTQLSCSRIFLDKNIKDIIGEILTDEKWLYFPKEFNFIRKDYPLPEFVMQYNETNFDFICWNLEQNGAYFYFDQDENNPNNIRDKIIFCDHPASHISLNKTGQTTKLSYAEVSGLDFNRREEVIFSFKLKQSPLPKNIVVRDYDWKNPNRTITGTANVSNKGLGTIYLSNENVETEADANRIAKIRAEELQCHSKTYYGKSVIPALRPGFTFELTDHYNQRFNQEYLLTKVTHEGCQESFLTLGLGIPMQEIKKFSLNSVENVTDVKDTHYYYYNDFECIQADQVYRPKRTAPRAEIKGVIRGFIDGAGDSSRPEVDGFGRYKVIFPFDISGREKGKASCWIRRSQEQVGMGSGMNFPLLGGVEVTISFINGNPNLPIISGALANGESNSLAHSGNTNTEGIYTAGGNRLVFGNKDNKQGFALQTAAGRGITVGAGSLSTTQINTDFGLNVANAAITEIGGLFKDVYTGLSSSTTVSVPDPFNNKLFFVINGLLKASSGITGEVSTILKSKSANISKSIAAKKKELEKETDSAKQEKIKKEIENLEKDLEACKKDDENTKFSSDMLKVGQILYSTLHPKFEYGFTGKATNNRAYSANLTTSSDSAGSSFKVLPEKQSYVIAQAVASLALSLLPSLKDIHSDAIGTSSDQQTLNDTIGDDTSTEDDKKRARVLNKMALSTKYINTGIAKLLPEILALIAIKGTSDSTNAHLGGISINSKNANVNVAARDTVSVHSARGVLTNTEDLYVVGGELSGTNSYSTGPLPTQVEYIETETFRSYDGKEKLGKKPSGSYLNWGIADTEDKVVGDYKYNAWSDRMSDIIKDDPKNEKSLTGFLQKRISNAEAFSVVPFTYQSELNKTKIVGKPSQPKTYEKNCEQPDTNVFKSYKVMKHRFIANQTEHIINVANFGTDIFAGQKYNTAYSFVYSTTPINHFPTESDNADDKGKGITQMRLHTKGDTNALSVNNGDGVYQPSKTGFIVDVFGAAANDHSITLRAHSADQASANDDNYKTPSSWLNLSKDVAELSVAKDDNQKQMIKATNEDILIGVTNENKNYVDVINLTNGLYINDLVTSIYRGNSYIRMDGEGNIFMKTTDSSQNKVQIDNVAIQNDTIIAKTLKSSDDAGIIDIGGAIKIVQADHEKLEKLDKKDEKKEEKREEVYDDRSENIPPNTPTN